MTSATRLAARAAAETMDTVVVEKSTSTQAERIAAASARFKSNEMNDADARHQITPNTHSEHHFFAIAAHKLIEYRDWCSTFGLCKNVDFAEIDGFQKAKIRDLRNMREHVVDYFKGERLDHSLVRGIPPLVEIHAAPTGRRIL